MAEDGPRASTRAADRSTPADPRENFTQPTDHLVPPRRRPGR
jgi:hypothetical protein